MKKPLLLFTALLVTAITTAQTLRLAVYQYADNPRIKNLQPLADHLQKTLGVQTTVKSYPTVHAFIQGIQNGETDLAFINTFGYLLLEAGRRQYPMIPVLALTVPNAQDNYKTAFLSRKGSSFNTIDDLAAHAKDIRLALVAEGSTSGNLVPRMVLTKWGVTNAEKAFQSLFYAGTHAKAVEALLSGRADVAAMGSSEYTRLTKDGKDSLKLIWLSSEIPLGPVLLNKSLDPSLQKGIIATLLRIHQTAPPSLEALKAAWSEAKQATHFVRIKKDHYTPFLKQFGSSKEITPILKQFAN